MAEEQTKLLRQLAEDMKSLKGSVGVLSDTVNGLEAKIMTNIRTTIREETKKFDTEIELLKGRLGNMESRLQQLDGGAPADTFNLDKSVIIINLPQHDTEDTAAVCRDLFADVLGVAVTVTLAERTRRRDNNKPAVIKCQLSNLEEKITVLRSKMKVKDVDVYKNVFIARMRSHEERLIELNFKSILHDLPNGDQYRFTGSGRLVPREDVTENGAGVTDDRSGGNGAGDVQQNPGGAAGGPSSPGGRSAADVVRDGQARTRSQNQPGWQQQRGRGGRGGRGGTRGRHQ